MNNTFKKRIDELGRIVIPKQIRNSFKIKNFDELELFVENDTIVLKKSVGIELYKDKIDRFLCFIRQFVNYDILVTDKNKILVSTDKNISSNDEIIINTNSFNNEIIIIIKKRSHENLKFLAYSLPIIIDSNQVGDMYFFNNDKQVINLNDFKFLRDLVIDLIS